VALRIRRLATFLEYYCYVMFAVAVVSLPSRFAIERRVRNRIAKTVCTDCDAEYGLLAARNRRRWNVGVYDQIPLCTVRCPTCGHSETFLESGM